VRESIQQEKVLDVDERFSFGKRVLHVLRALRLRGPLAGDPTAQMLHAFLVSLTLWLGAWSIILLPAYANPPGRLIGALVQIIIPLGALVLLRLGFLRRASVFYLAASWIFATYIVAFNGGIRSPLLSYFIAVPIMASWLLGFRGALWSIVASAGSTLAFAVVDMAGMNLPHPYASPLGIWAVLMQVALTGAIPVAQILKALNKALEREQEHGVELEQRESALRESEERFRNMANTAPVKIILMDANRQAIFLNKTWLDFTGRPMEEEMGYGWTAGVHPDDREEALATLSASPEAQVGFRMEYRLRRADGEYRSVLCRSVPRFEPHGAFAGYIASAVDITDLKQALAGQKLESLGVLATGIAHDFNNLLGGVLAGSELLLSEIGDRSPIRNELERIRLTALRGSEIVQQLMVYAGEESATSEDVDLAGLVREMMQLIEISISKNAGLKIDVPREAPSVRANKSQIRQVVMNLITNASEALGDRGGMISVSLEHVPSQPEAALEAVRTFPAGDLLRLRVRDSGCGMSEEIHARIFDPFFSTKNVGRGMGLAAVRGIIQSHGGTIDVQSAVGSGSCFEILLPCAPKASRDSRFVTSAPLKASGTLNPTVLIIDDEDALRQPVAQMLRRKRFSILETGDGAIGVDLFRARAQDIDVVLLDLTLPGMSGPDVLRELRQLRPDIRIVLSTAYGREKAMAAVGQQAFVYYLRKPYRVQQLIDLLYEVCLGKPAVRHTSV
jgi:PAS domain S-box-containing protein